MLTLKERNIFALEEPTKFMWMKAPKVMAPIEVAREDEGVLKKLEGAGEEAGVPLKVSKEVVGALSAGLEGAELAHLKGAESAHPDACPEGAGQAHLGEAESVEGGPFSFSFFSFYFPHFLLLLTTFFISYCTPLVLPSLIL